MKIMREKYCNFRYTKQFFGIYKVKFDINTYNVIYKFLGIRFMKKTFFAGFSRYTILKFFKIKQSRKHTLSFLLPILSAYLHEQNCMQTDIVCLMNRSGETFLMQHHFKEWLKKNKIKQTVFITVFPYLNNLVQMFYPKIPFSVVPKVFFEIYLAAYDKTELNHKNTRIFFPLPHAHFIELEKKQQKERVNFYAAIKNRLKVNGSIITLPKYSETVIKSAQAKMKLLGLKKPFAFVAPDAQSNGTNTLDFWNNMIVELSNLGYDMFFNTIPWNVQASYYKHCWLSLSEAKYIAEQADIILGVRSGLMDVIANKKSKIHCIYHAFFDRGKGLPMLDAKKVIKGFSLKYLPYTSSKNVFEYDGQRLSNEELLKEIIRNIKTSQ